MGSRQLVIRAGRRCALAVAAVGIVAAAGALDAGPAPAPSPERSSAVATVESAPSAARGTGAAPSAYSLQTQGGPRSVRVARVVTGTMLLTGLVLTALGAIGMRGPELIRRKVALRASYAAGASRYRWSAPSPRPAHPPTIPGTGPPGA
ncbi:hypothetical protein B4N89_16425 [Embleya scabrispora]|uniref:Uncharacterized protein n=1 Tax=Embleya scabrispora TaxID=159449 RepID=A0A1T3NZN8_9ACTN|nr:hypothetical protein [Embleya scabrispora]OPC82308.1 hypothetical protein B4N89_16425 [Embleya scabrispora]